MLFFPTGKLLFKILGGKYMVSLFKKKKTNIYTHGWANTCKYLQVLQVNTYVNIC